MATITTTYKGDMLFEANIGGHKITIDVPPAMGGNDRGPTPPQLFIASLGSCVGAFVAQYCERNGIDPKELSIDISFDKADNPTRLVNIKATVNLPFDTCHDREAAIKRVAEHCPVHETIETMEGITFEIRDKTALEPAGD